MKWLYLEFIPLIYLSLNGNDDSFWDKFMWEIACAKIVRERKMQTHVCIQNYMSYMINKMQLFPTKHKHIHMNAFSLLLCIDLFGNKSWTATKWMSEKILLQQKVKNNLLKRFAFRNVMRVENYHSIEAIF